MEQLLEKYTFSGQVKRVIEARIKSERYNLNLLYGVKLLNDDLIWQIGKYQHLGGSKKNRRTKSKSKKRKSFKKTRRSRY